MNTPLAEISEVYRVAAGCSVILHPRVTHPLVDEFRRAAKIAMRAIPGPEAMNWRIFRRETQQLSFALHHAPLPICHRSYDQLLTTERFDDAIRYSDKALAATIVRLQSARHAIAEEYASPYRDLLNNIIAEPEYGSAVVVVEPRWVEDVTSHLRGVESLRSLKVLSSRGSDLAGRSIYKRLYVMGSLASHPAAVLTASRSMEVHWLLFPWMKTQPAPYTCRLQTKQWWTLIRETQDGEVKITEPPVVSSDVEEEEEWTPPSRYWDAIASSVTNAGGYFCELVDAKVLAVAGDDVVLVPREKNIDCVDPTTLAHAPELTIESRLGRDVRPGDFIIVYSRGSAEHITTVANALLGSRAEQCRNAQRRWKERLQQAVEDTGLESVSAILQVYGAVTAEPYHVRYWISPYFIHPKDPRDFTAIMKAIGLPSCVEEYWDLMTEIMTKHQLAGKKIKAALRERIRTIDPSALVRSGRWELGEDEDTGNLTVVYVERVLADCQPVPEAHLLRFLE